MVEHSRQTAVDFFEKYCDLNNEELSGKLVYDLSAGSGFISNIFHVAGAQVHPYDLYPDQNKYTAIPSQKIDLQKPFPIESNVVDIAICAETIEHLPDQYFFFQELTRILKIGGRCILTTPNHSSLRSRLAYFLMESEHYSVSPPNKLDFKVTYASGNTYLNRIFLIGIQKLNTLASVHNLDIIKINKSKKSLLSWLLLFAYPKIWISHWVNYRKQIRKNPNGKEIFYKSFMLNTSLDILLNNHLIVELKKMN